MRFLNAQVLVLERMGRFVLMQGTYEYAVQLRRQLHQYPEIGFDLPKTLALVRRELDAMGIPYTEEYGRSSIVGTINPDCTGFTIGLRGDMDALPIQEVSDKPYCSKIPGQMHACGHDAHTAMLLATARELKAREKELTCRVKLLFTPAEEYINPGCKEMVEDGVMEDIDCAIAFHVNPALDVGQVRISSGGINGNSMGFTVEFFGTSSHAAAQQRGHDAISMAVEAYTAMEIMVAKEIAPTTPRLLNIGTIHGGETNNVICNYCKMYCSSRTHSDDVTEFIIQRVREICDSVAKMSGGESKVTVNKFLPCVINNENVVERVKATLEKVIGEENILPMIRGLGGEDFSFLSRVKPCALISLGTRGDDPNTGVALHNDHFDLDERAMGLGVEIFVQFVLDNMGGIDLTNSADK